MKTIISEGSSGLLLPAYTIHPGYAYKTEKRHNENGYTWGGGISRNFIDSRGNRRIMYAMAFSDSHNNFEPFMGYGWLSRWRLGSTPFYAEAGYTIGLTARGDYKWIPFPAPLPLVGVGTDNFSIYGTYVPFSDIFFFFANMTFDDRKTRTDLRRRRLAEDNAEGHAQTVFYFFRRGLLSRSALLCHSGMGLRFLR